ncbi:MAG: group II intron reverse transcriptase/maturase [Psychromonas sp.]
MNVERRDCVKRIETRAQLPKGRRKSHVQSKHFEISKWDMLSAFDKVKANKGGAGVDGVTIEDFEKDLKNNLYKIWNRMSSGTYFPPPVQAVSIPKKSGGERILGIPTVSDRVAQTVVRDKLEIILERYFLEDSYGYRVGKSAKDAIEVTKKRCWQYDWVLEFDIKGLFDNIRHDLLMKAVTKHISTAEVIQKQKLQWMILYIERWLIAPLQLADGKLEERNVGTPQGGVVSPVLANLFLHYVFDKWMGTKHPDNPWCRYADDGLVHTKTKYKAELLYKELSERFKECGLEMHPVKTKIVYCKDDWRKSTQEQNTQFDFLGFTFRARTCKSQSSGRLVNSFTPAVSMVAKKSMRRKIKELKVRQKTQYSLEQLAKWLNPMLRGWINYYGQFRRSELDSVFRHFNKTLVRWARRKFKKLKIHKSRTIDLFDKLSVRCPNLFAHWQFGSSRSFA